MDTHLRRLAARQSDVVARWQLLEAGWTRKKVEHHAQSLGREVGACRLRGPPGLDGRRLRLARRVRRALRRVAAPLRVVALHRALVARRRRRVAAARVGLDELLALRAVGGRSAVARRIRHALAERSRVLPAGTTRSHLAARGPRRGGAERPVLRALLGSLREPARVAGRARLLEGAGASACEGGLQRGPAGRPSVLLRIAARVPDLVAGERGDHDRRHDERTECGRARCRHGPPPFAPREEAALNALSYPAVPL